MDINLKERRARALGRLKLLSTSEKALFCLTLLLWIDRILLKYARAVVLRIPIIGGMADYIISTVYILLVLFSLPQLVKYMRLSDAGVLFFAVLICVLNYMIFPENIAMLDRYLPQFLFLTIPLYFIGLALDFEKLYPWIYKLSLLTIALFTMYVLFINAPVAGADSVYQGGDMWAAYNLLPHVCVVSLAMLRKPSVVNVGLAVIGVVMIASLGSRGPLFCVVLAIVVYLMLFKKYKNPILSRFLIIGIAAVVVWQLDAIMLFLYDTAKSAGLSVRIFEKFFEGALSDSSGRDIIAERLYERIGENPIVGYGLFADRVAINSYAHNLAIELWHSFGIVFGTMILIGIVVVLLRAAKVVKKREQYGLLFIPLFSTGFVKLFLSGSILNELYFFMLLGFSVNLIRGYKRS